MINLIQPLPRVSPGAILPSSCHESDLQKSEEIRLSAQKICPPKLRHVWAYAGFEEKHFYNCIRCGLIKQLTIEDKRCYLSYINIFDQVTAKAPACFPISNPTV